VNNEANSSFMTYALPGDQQLNGVIATPDGGMILYGTTDASEGGKKDGLVVKLDAKRQFVWSKNLGGIADDEVNSVAVDEVGNITAFGISYSYDQAIDSGNTSQRSVFYVWNLNPNGEVIWQRSFHPKIGDTYTNKAVSAKRINYDPKTQKFYAVGIFEYRSIGISWTYYAVCFDKQGHESWFYSIANKKNFDEFVDAYVNNENQLLLYSTAYDNTISASRCWLNTFSSDGKLLKYIQVGTSIDYLDGAIEFGRFGSNQIISSAINQYGFSIWDNQGIIVQTVPFTKASITESDAINCITMQDQFVYALVRKDDPSSTLNFSNTLLKSGRNGVIIWEKSYGVKNNLILKAIEVVEEQKIELYGYSLNQRGENDFTRLLVNGNGEIIN
jgi:hypothetical protein